MTTRPRRLSGRIAVVAAIALTLVAVRNAPANEMASNANSPTVTVGAPKIAVSYPLSGPMRTCAVPCTVSFSALPASPNGALPVEATWWMRACARCDPLPPDIIATSGSWVFNTSADHVVTARIAYADGSSATASQWIPVRYADSAVAPLRLSKTILRNGELFTITTRNDRLDGPHALLGVRARVVKVGRRLKVGSSYVFRYRLKNFRRGRHALVVFASRHQGDFAQLAIQIRVRN